MHPLEGSRQEAIIPLTPLLTTVFRGVPPGTPLRLVAVDASRFSCVWCRLCRRRTIHPSGSRPLDVSPSGQTSAPGTWRAPANRRCPAVSHRRLRTNVMAPWRVPLPDGSRQRHRQTPQCGGRPSGMG
jgi:hypothetical protein